jgi:DNA-binding CsgD family transcriptional regulator
MAKLPEGPNELRQELMKLLPKVTKEVTESGCWHKDDVDDIIADTLAFTLLGGESNVHGQKMRHDPAVRQFEYELNLYDDPAKALYDAVVNTVKYRLSLRKRGRADHPTAFKLSTTTAGDQVSLKKHVVRNIEPPTPRKPQWTRRLPDNYDLEDPAKLFQASLSELTSYADSLTDRQHEVFTLWMEGVRGKDIAERLQLSEGRIAQHKHAIIKCFRSAMGAAVGSSS